MSQFTAGKLTGYKELLFYEGVAEDDDECISCTIVRGGIHVHIYGAVAGCFIKTKG